MTMHHPVDKLVSALHRPILLFNMSFAKVETTHPAHRRAAQTTLDNARQEIEDIVKAWLFSIAGTPTIEMYRARVGAGTVTSLSLDGLKVDLAKLGGEAGPIQVRREYRLTYAEDWKDLE